MDDALDLVLQPLVHVVELPGMVALLTALGGRVVQGGGAGDWAQVRLGGAEVGLLAHPPNPAQGGSTVELNLLSRTPLERVEAAVRAAGQIVEQPTTTTGFGRQLVVRTGDGLLVKVNEIDPDRLG